MTSLEIVQLLGSLGEFLGAIAVFATLLYLAVQVREASRTAQFTAVQANRAQRISAFTANRDSPYYPAILVKLRAGEELTPEEQIRLVSHESSSWALTYSEWAQRELGMMGEFATSDQLTLELLFSSPWSMEWWRTVGVQLYPPAFVEYVTERAAAREELGSVALDTAAIFTDISQET